MGAIAARVTRIERDRSKARARREPKKRAVEPGRLLKLVPRISPQYEEPEHLTPFALEIERSMHESVEVCVSIPPRHGKTTLLLHAIVWILLNDPTATILYASYAHGFAAKQVRKAMRLAIRAGIALGETRRRDEWTTAAGGCVKAVGVGGQITGEGFRWIFVDDPHKNRAEAESRTIREGVIDGFLSDIYTRQDPMGTSVFVVHTRWHEADLIGALTAASRVGDDGEREGPEPFRLINLTALQGVAANDGSYETRSLAPSLFTVERLLKIRSRIGEYAWASLYEGSPRPKGGLLFGDVHLIDRLETGGTYRYAIGIDMSRTARTRSDWNAAVVMRRAANSKVVEVVEVMRHQGTLTDRVDARGTDAARLDDGFLKRLHALSQRYPGAPIVMYVAKDETQTIALMGRHDTYPVRVRATLAERDKWSRAQPYASAWNDPDGRVRVLRSAPCMNAFIAEHVAFTGAEGERDDQVDAAAAAYDALVRGGGQTKPRGTGQGSEAERIGRRMAV
jgi:phage terminase large subunit-like protein